MAPRGGRYNKHRGRGRGGGRGGGGGGGGNRQYQDNRVSFENVDKRNEKFERFYNTLDIVPSGPEREAFWSTLRRELPNSFRFTGSKGHALSVRHNLVERFFPILKNIKHEGRPVELPTSMPWYPEGLAYSMTTPKKVLRKYEPFKEFQKFLVSETNVGNISRQEQVSMIPPLLLDIRPEHTVLDLCAAPGSKSAQLIEAIHAGEEERVERAIKVAKGVGSTNGVGVHEDAMQDSGRTTGLLIANDVNYQRAQMLVHQVKRLNSPNLVVTNHDATLFPSIALPTTNQAGQPNKNKYLKFDRILADVPCSGDGTCRKNPGIWKDWSPQNGLGLYITQVRILTRALQMLKVGGRVVYSTCSLNPVENEAVVSSAIERCGGVQKVNLVDCSSELPGLERKAGLEDWSVMNREGKIYESYPEAAQYEPEGSKVVPGMFPAESQENIPLRWCTRVYPHQQDTGGFFIAVLEKLGEIRAKPESESKSMNKAWTFEPESTTSASVGTSALQGDAESVPMPTTQVGRLMEEASHPSAPRETEAEMSSAAAIQNRAGDETMLAGAGSKRPAVDEDGDEDVPSAKRTKVGDDETLADADMDENHPGAELDSNGDGGASLVSPAATPEKSEMQPAPRRRRRDNEAANEESFKYLSPDHPELESIYSFYELHPSFPRDRFLVRNPAGDPVKGIYYSSQLAKDILTANEGRGMKFVHAGVKMFMKQDVQGQKDVCRWRIQTEGLPIIEGWVGESRVVRLTKRATLRKLLVEMFPKVGGEDTAEGTGWRALGEIGEQVFRLGMGCCVLRVEPNGEEDDADGFKEPIVLPLWRSMWSVNLMLPKEERKAMLLRLFNEDVELVNHSDPRPSRIQPGEADEADDVQAGAGAGAGSIPAGDEAEELQEQIANAPDEGDEGHVPADAKGGGGSGMPPPAEPVVD